jgi:hypothetical protein
MGKPQKKMTLTEALTRVPEPAPVETRVKLSGLNALGDALSKTLQFSTK